MPRTNMSELPQFYGDITPLESDVHHDLYIDAPTGGDFAFAAAASAIAITVDEFAAAQAHYAVVFSKDAAMPIMLTGLPGEANRYVDADGRWRPGSYVPAYVRRYPFALVRIDEQGDELALCFDSSSKRLNKKKNGNIFSRGKLTDHAQDILSFCENYEFSTRQTMEFVGRLRKFDLLIDGQAQIIDRDGKSNLLNGFQMVSDERLTKLNVDEYRELIETNSMMFLYSHLMSLKNISEIL